MRVDIGNNIQYFENFEDNTLPEQSESFESVFLAEGRGQFIEAFLEFDSEKISFQMKIDGEIKIQSELEELEAFHDSYKNELSYSPSLVFYKDNKILKIKFPLPIQFNESFEFLAKTNDGNKTKKLKGFQVVYNKEI